MLAKNKQLEREVDRCKDESKYMEKVMEQGSKSLMDKSKFKKLIDYNLA